MGLMLKRICSQKCNIRLTYRNGTRLSDPCVQVRLKGGVEVRVPSKLVKDRHLCIYWRMLRPEFVKTFGESQDEEVW